MRLLHTMLRVGDLQRSIDFYTKTLEMRLLRTSENPEYKYTLAFVGYTDESEGAVIELTYNWGVESYDLGSTYGHIALGVDNTARRLRTHSPGRWQSDPRSRAGERRYYRYRFYRRSGRL